MERQANTAPRGLHPDEFNLLSPWLTGRNGPPTHVCAGRAEAHRLTRIACRSSGLSRGPDGDGSSPGNTDPPAFKYQGGAAPRYPQKSERLGAGHTLIFIYIRSRRRANLPQVARPCAGCWEAERATCSAGRRRRVPLHGSACHVLAACLTQVIFYPDDTRYLVAS